MKGYSPCITTYNSNSKQRIGEKVIKKEQRAEVD